MFNCVFVAFPCGILGQVLDLIVSIPDLCCLSAMYINVTMTSCAESALAVLIFFCDDSCMQLLKIQQKQGGKMTFNSICAS